MSKKRSRTTTDTTTETDASSSCGLWFQDTCQYLQANGAIVHKALQWNDTQRILTVSTAVPPDTILLSIPLSCCIRATSPDKRMTTTMEQDVRLATEIIGNDNDKSKAYYTQTLPQSTQQQEYMPSLPMFWTDHQLGLLENCREFCKRVRQQQADLETILAQSTIIQSNDASNPGPLQQQERYAVQVALTHVLSRAFTLDNGEPILVPILDLCNHTRGQYFPTTTTTTNSNSTTTTPTAQSRKNVSYRIVNDDNNNHHKTMVVSTVQDVAAQQELFITYGALGNGPLLLKYGFCLTVDTTNGWSSNVEPDGSSNDVLELRLDPASDVVLELRTGPKAYTFGPLTKAVGQFQQQQVSRNTSDGANGVNDDLDDMEAFLNDAEEEEGQEFMDDLYKDSPGEEGDDNDDEDDEDVRNEIKALRQLEKSLWDVHGTHTNKAMSTTTVTTEASLDSSDATAPTAMMERYCATLIQSERRTLAFYALAAHTVASKLEGSNQGNESTRMSLAEYDWPEAWNEPDRDLLQSQVKELVDTYIRIRHPYSGIE